MSPQETEGEKQARAIYESMTRGYETKPPHMIRPDLPGSVLGVLGTHHEAGNMTTATVIISVTLHQQHLAQIKEAIANGEHYPIIVTA